MRALIELEWNAIDAEATTVRVVLGREALAARRWVEAAGDRVDAVKRGPGETFDRAKSATGKFAGSPAKRASRLRRNDAED